MQGIDVSSHNPPQDWHALAASIGFAGVRVSYGTSLDVAAQEHLEGAHAAGIGLLLAYHYLTLAPAAEQARVFLDRVAALEGIVGEFALAVDLEDLPGKPPWPRDEYEATAREFIRIVKDTKRRPCGVYLSPAFAAQLDMSRWFAEAPLWLARWASTPGQPPKPWTGITIWQNRVDSIDHDVAGTTEDFRRAFGLGLTVMPLDVLGGVVTVSNAVAGRCSGKAEDFCERGEGP